MILAYNMDLAAYKTFDSVSSSVAKNIRTFNFYYQGKWAFYTSCFNFLVLFLKN